MNREKTVEILKRCLMAEKVINKITYEPERRKILNERIEAYEFAIKELDGTIPKVKVKEFLSSDKKREIIVTVNGELVEEENIEFISEMRTAQEVSVQETSRYNDKVNTIRNKSLIGFNSQKEDTQLIVRIIETLAGEENLTVSRAQSILSDAVMILPMVGEI